ncbi:pyridoxal-phosphate dependent enzyme [Roseovarius aestuariivivens]|uniref:pyridoxal-phosphate dependent enzyme n=1 Tax=Roseovarius aestuariivivens TaxID=1888910 RepID=UPI0010810DDF|nr:pyridoxal-phosphate dependent enzyme [Roseovarius aestuariivivens]
MQIDDNPHRGKGLPHAMLADIPDPSIDAAAPETMLTQCPAACETPLVALTGFDCAVWAKDERGRMGLGSFKALGAAYVIAHAAAETGAEDLSTALAGQTYVTASAGNHGMSVAAGARIFGGRAVIYLSDTVPDTFAQRLRDKGAEVVRAGNDYETSMEAAHDAAHENDWILLSDSSWPRYTELPHRLMEGYLVMAAEAARQMPQPPTHIFLQAGVGGLAAACAAWFRQVWGDAPEIIVVEPHAAPALHASISAGEPVATIGPVSAMGRLDCKEPSLIALKGLARDADRFALISEEEAASILPLLAGQDMATTESGAAGVAALKLSTLGPDDVALVIISEMADA